MLALQLPLDYGIKDYRSWLVNAGKRIAERGNEVER